MGEGQGLAFTVLMRATGLRGIVRCGCMRAAAVEDTRSGPGFALCLVFNLSVHAAADA